VSIFLYTPPFVCLHVCACMRICMHVSIHPSPRSTTIDPSIYLSRSMIPLIESGKAILKKSNSHSVRVITTVLYESFTSMKWQTKKGRLVDERDLIIIIYHHLSRYRHHLHIIIIYLHHHLCRYHHHHHHLFRYHHHLSR